jgi:hypothetical protein
MPAKLSAFCASHNGPSLAAPMATGLKLDIGGKILRMMQLLLNAYRNSSFPFSNWPFDVETLDLKEYRQIH